MQSQNGEKCFKTEKQIKKKMKIENQTKIEKITKKDMQKWDKQKPVGMGGKKHLMKIVKNCNKIKITERLSNIYPAPGGPVLFSRMKVN